MHRHRQEYHSDFFKALERLNPIQEAAVNQLDGPVMVLAGPGTGKTQILTARIGQILLHTDTQPGEILCLTFSDAGVKAMKQRLLQWIGPEAYRVPIFTFHSFAGKIIRENPALFGGSDMEVIDDIERNEIIRGLIANLSYDNPLTVRNPYPYLYEPHLKDLFQWIKHEDWDSDALIRQIDEYINSLPEHKDFLYKKKYGSFVKGDLKQGKYKKEVNAMELLKAGVRLFPSYVQALNEIGRYDYADMIHWVVKAFNKKSYLLKRYQEQYQYFLVDEFQDTNGIQNHLLGLLISFWSNPNVFVVGDDDQSVYGFQGARIKNVSDFYQKFRESIHLFVLTDNYRSHQDILDASGRLIDKNKLRVIHQDGIDVSKTLVAKATVRADIPLPVEVISYENSMHEVTGIFDSIKASIDRGLKYADIAIIYRKNKVGDELAKLLAFSKIPFHLNRPANLLDDAIFKRLFRWLLFLEKGRSYSDTVEYLVFDVLSMHEFDCHPRDIVRINSYRKDTRITWDKILWDEVWDSEDSSNFHGLELLQPEKIKHLLRLADELMTDLTQLSIVEWIEKVINVSGFLSLALNHVDRDWQLDVLASFRQVVKDLVLKIPLLTLADLNRHLTGLNDNQHRIPIQKTIGVEDGVQLLTAHSAKGMEYRHVIMPYCTDKWENSRDGNKQFSIPGTVHPTSAEDNKESERRLFYVAMTRAQDLLSISYSLKDDGGKGNNPSKFVAELDLPTALRTPADRQLDHVRQALLAFDVKPTLAIEHDLIREELNDFVLSVSALNSYLECPVRFYYDYILKIPSEPSVPFLFGNAIHYALQKYFNAMAHNRDKLFPGVRQLVAYFTQRMNHQKGYFPKEAFGALLVRGERLLTDYYGAKSGTWIQDAIAEYSIGNVEIEGIPLKGVIDRIDFVDGQNAVITDYKTGSYQASSGISDKKELGSPYWRQLVFYALIFERQRADSRRVGKGIISFVERNKEGRLREVEHDISPADKNAVWELIKDTWENIQAQNFDEGCGKPKCPWCQFVKNNELSASFRDEAVLGLDD